MCFINNTTRAGRTEGEGRVIGGVMGGANRAEKMIKNSKEKGLIMYAIPKAKELLLKSTVIHQLL